MSVRLEFFFFKVFPTDHKKLAKGCSSLSHLNILENSKFMVRKCSLPVPCRLEVRAKHDNLPQRRSQAGAQDINQ